MSRRCFESPICQRVESGSLKLLWFVLKTNMTEAIIHTINQCIALDKEVGGKPQAG
jgi:hypothetical protein